MTQRKTQIAAQSTHAGQQPAIRMLGQRGFRIAERAQCFFMTVHDSQRRGDAEQRQSLGHLVRCEVECFAIRGQAIVRLAQLQSQFADEAAHLVQQQRFACQCIRLAGKHQRALESQGRLFGLRCLAVGASGTGITSRRQMLGTDRTVAFGKPLRGSQMQLLAL